MLAAGERLREIDLARGLVVVLMALDHARDYLHADAYAFNPLDPEKSYAVLFATRWVTHLCAPTFVFLAGVSAFLQNAKGKSGAALSGFLFTRGLWLIAIEMTVVSLSWDFAIPWFVDLQVIWAIGMSMLALSALVFLPRVAVLIIGVCIIAGHNLLDPVTFEGFGAFATLWMVLHEPGPILSGDNMVAYIDYPVLPWVGVMALGYGAGPMFLAPQAARTRLSLGIGAGMLLAFAVLRGFNIYGDPAPWQIEATFAQTVMAFLNVQKYPPSLMYLLATLGVMALMLPLMSRLKGGPAKALAVFGAVPFFFYVLHIPLIHAGAIAVHAAAGRDGSSLVGWLSSYFIAPERLTGLGFGLGVAYLLWIAAVATLYWPCRWFAEVKKRRRDWWLSYL
jgi:uncharacterized membrane protein